MQCSTITLRKFWPAGSPVSKSLTATWWFSSLAADDLIKSGSLSGNVGGCTDQQLNQPTDGEGK